ncbi:UNVERIFIED_CONTAM: hypothetical protein BEN50_21545 [Euhalothece sp. KZN 001]
MTQKQTTPAEQAEKINQDNVVAATPPTLLGSTIRRVEELEARVAKAGAALREVDERVFGERGVEADASLRGAPSHQAGAVHFALDCLEEQIDALHETAKRLEQI